MKIVRSIIAALTALAVLAQPALAVPQSRPAAAAASFTLPPHLGPIANGKLAQAYSASIKSCNSRADIIFDQSAPSFIIGFEHSAFIPTNNSTPASAEAGNGAATTIKAQIEYPAGNYTPVTFGGGATGTIPDKGYVASDAITIKDAQGNILVPPKGQRAWVRSLANNPNGLSTDATLDAAAGSGSNCSSTVNSQADLTGGGSITANGIGIPATFVVGQTTLPSVCFIGDSRVAGLTDTPTDGLPDIGTLARTFGSAGLPYINLAVSGERAIDFKDGHTARAAIANAYCPQGVISDYNTNDFVQVAGITVAQALANQQAIAGYFPGKPFFLTTLDPITTTTDAWATLSGQTITNVGVGGNAINDLRVAYNKSLRGSLPTWAAGLFDTALVTEPSLNSGLWCGSCTSDGVHSNKNGARKIRASGVVDLSRFQGSSPVSRGQIGLDQTKPEVRSLENALGTLDYSHLQPIFCLLSGCALAGPSSISGASFTVKSTNGILVLQDWTNPANETWIWRNNNVWVLYDVPSGQLASFASGVFTVPQLVVSGQAKAASMQSTKQSAAPAAAAGAGVCQEQWVAGTNSGSCKKIAVCGTSTTPVTIVDNVGSGC